MVVLGVVGALMALFGTIFFLQGIGVLQGSAMSGTVTWSILGPIIALAGVALARHALLTRR